MISPLLYSEQGQKICDLPVEKTVKYVQLTIKKKKKKKDFFWSEKKNHTNAIFLDVEYDDTTLKESQVLDVGGNLDWKDIERAWFRDPD